MTKLFFLKLITNLKQQLISIQMFLILSDDVCWTVLGNTKSLKQLKNRWIFNDERYNFDHIQLPVCPKYRMICYFSRWPRIQLGVSLRCFYRWIKTENQSDLIFFYSSEFSRKATFLDLSGYKRCEWLKASDIFSLRNK